MKNRTIYILNLAFVIALFLGNSVSAFAQEEKHFLDISLEQCMEENPGTTAERICMNNHLALWDKELNKYYKLLGGSKNIKLRDAQRAWISYRDAEYENIETTFGLDGSMYYWIIAKKKLNILRTRVLMLQSQYDFLEQHR